VILNPPVTLVDCSKVQVQPDAPRTGQACSGPFRQRKEANMSVHLPILIMITLTPVAASDTVPNFDIARECRSESGLKADYDRCSDDERTALRELQKTWTQFAVTDKRTCVVSTTIGGFASYVELLVCLQLARDVHDENDGPRNPRATDAIRPHAPGETVGIGRDPITSGQIPSQGGH
jgi:hypothetical protein